MRRFAWLALLASRVAAADGDGDGDGITVRVPERWQEDTGPALHLDHVLPDAAEGPAASHDHKTTIWELGPLARVVAQGDWWSSMESPDVPGPHDLELSAHGWRAGVELSHDFGWFRLAAYAAAGHVDSRFERGDYTLAGVSISRTFRISRWTLAWISFSLGLQQWNGEPPLGQANSATGMLSFGFTFR